MNIVVKKSEDCNISNHHGFEGDAENASKIGFNLSEEDLSVHELKDSKIPLLNFSRRYSGTSKFNISIGAMSPVVIETSIIMHGSFLKEAIDPLVPVNVKLAFTSTKNFWIGVMFVAMFVIAGSLVGPATLFLPSHNTLAKALWRMEANFVWAVPLMLIQYAVNGDKMDWRKDFSSEMLLNVAITTFFGFIWYIGLVVGCSLTITSHAMVMYSSTGVYMLLFAIITWKYVHKFEYMGYGLFFTGVFLMFIDPYAVKKGGGGNRYLGDLIAFLGAWAGAIFGYCNSRNSKLIDPLVLTTQFYFFSIVYQIIFGVMVSGPIFFTFDSQDGAFGWLTDTEMIILLLLVIAPFTGLLFNIGLFVSYKYFPMEIIASAILLQPFISQIAGVLFGQDNIPGFLTIFGLCVITSGFLTASYGSRLKAFEEVAKICEHDHLISRVELEELTKKKSFKP